MEGVSQVQVVEEVKEYIIFFKIYVLKKIARTGVCS